MREEENIYRNVCATVELDSHRARSELHPRFTFVIGAEANEVHSRRTQADEIWMKKWHPIMFAQGVVVLAFDQMLTRDVIVQLANRAIRQNNAKVNVAGSE